MIKQNKKMGKNTKTKTIGESFSDFMSGFTPLGNMISSEWEMRDGHYVQFSMYSDQKRSVAETNESFSARL